MEAAASSPCVSEAVPLTLRCAPGRQEGLARVTWIHMIHCTPTHPVTTDTSNTRTRSVAVRGSGAAPTDQRLAWCCTWHPALAAARRPPPPPVPVRGGAARRGGDRPSPESCTARPQQLTRPDAVLPDPCRTHDCLDRHAGRQWWRALAWQTFPAGQQAARCALPRRAAWSGRAVRGLPQESGNLDAFGLGRSSLKNTRSKCLCVGSVLTPLELRLRDMETLESPLAPRPGGPSHCAEPQCLCTRHAPLAPPTTCSRPPAARWRRPLPEQCLPPRGRRLG
ncbi:hypothetical protein E2C01_061245 [Portunus trituberculatus]|uniref:Uncharacterized protein n=1 Tax=Portunus trituberculatus TaxID=210409 RepID=A0A5B7H3C4_PORTR|nr:hypothetical protein [Portunus trituberculatus]